MNYIGNDRTMKSLEAFVTMHRLGKKPKFLLTGPSGCGKTYFGKAAAERLGLEVEIVTPEQLFTILRQKAVYKHLFDTLLIVNEIQSVKCDAKLMDVLEEANCPPLIATGMNISMFNGFETALESRFNLHVKLTLDIDGFAKQCREYFRTPFLPTGKNYREIVHQCELWDATGLEPDEPAMEDMPNSKMHVDISESNTDIIVGGFRVGQRVCLGTRQFTIQAFTGKNVFVDTDGKEHWISQIKGAVL